MFSSSIRLVPESNERRTGYDVATHNTRIAGEANEATGACKRKHEANSPSGMVDAVRRNAQDISKAKPLDHRSIGGCYDDHVSSHGQAVSLAVGFC